MIDSRLFLRTYEQVASLAFIDQISTLTLEVLVTSSLELVHPHRKTVGLLLALGCNRNFCNGKIFFFKIFFSLLAKKK